MKFGADVEATDDLGRRAVECVPDVSTFELVPDAQVNNQDITNVTLPPPLSYNVCLEKGSDICIDI